MDKPRRILVIRLSAIGDIIMASGIIPALRSLWPEAHLAWLAEEAHGELLRHNPRLDRLHLLPRRHWKQLRQQGEYRRVTGEMAAFARNLRAERYDLALDLQGLLKSGIWARASGARRRIGLGSKEGSQWLMTEVIPRVMDDPRISKEYRDLAVRLGAAPESFDMDIAVPDDARLRARELLRKAGVSGEPAILAPFTTRPQKHWFDERWAELAQGLNGRLTPVMLGGPADRERAARIAALAGPGLVNLVGQTTLTECAALIDDARLLVGVDTGLTHLGLAMRTPTVALFGSTMPYLDTTRPNGLVLYQPRPCSPCHRRPVCDGRFDCMAAHDVASVLTGIDRVLGPADASVKLA
jgi:heptosyltransferase-1